MKTPIHFAVLSLLLVLPQTTVGAENSPLDALVGTRTQIGTVYAGQNKVSVSTSVTCEKSVSETVVFCHGKNGTDFSWLDAFDWNQDTQVLTKTSLATVPGHGVTKLSATWNGKSGPWEFKGRRKNNDGTVTAVRSTREISDEGTHMFRYYETQQGTEVLIFEIRETPIK